MSAIEDRLSAALSARADLVQLEDLRPATPPTVVVPLRRRPSTWLVAAAASAALGVTPLLVFGGDGDDRPAPPVVTPSAPVTPNGDEVKGADWPKIYDYPQGYDVDGDGVADRLVIRAPGDEDLPHGVRRFEAQLSTGGVAAVLLDYDTYDLTAVAPVELGDGPGDEILYYRGTEQEEMGVLDLAGGALVDLAVPEDPGLSSNLDDQGRLRSRWVEDEALYSSRSVIGGFTEGDGGKERPERYAVDVWSWSLVDGRLVPVEEPQRCVEGPADDHPVPCEGPPTL